MISRLSTHPTKKIFARATPQESAMSRAKIAHAAARSDAVRVCSLGTPATSEDLGAQLAAAASTTAAAQRSTARAVVRGRSAFSPRVQTNPGPFPRDQFVSRCTPARWVAGKMDCQWPVPSGPGGAVAAATVLQPSCNREIITIQWLNAPVARLQQNASRHVRAYVCVHTRTHTRGQNSATVQPFTYHIDIEGIYGCRTVAKRLRLQPAMRSDVQSRANPAISNKILGGYSSAADVRPSDLPIRGQIGGRGAKTFGAAIFGGAIALGWTMFPASGRWSIGADLDEVQRVGGNGGFLRVCAGRSGRVGTAMLEWSGKRRGNASVVEPRRKLCRLTSGARRGADRLALGAASVAAAAGGVAPPCAARLVPSPLANAIFLKSIDDRNACPAASAKMRQVWGATTGPGVCAFPLDRYATAGRGVNADFGLCRSGQPSGGRAHVN